jgi:hypothetical protein
VDEVDAETTQLFPLLWLEGVTELNEMQTRKCTGVCSLADSLWFDRFVAQMIAFSALSVAAKREIEPRRNRIAIQRTNGRT